MPSVLICQARQAYSRLRPGRHEHIPGYLKRLAARLRPGFKPVKYARTRLARFHNNTLAVYRHDLSDQGGKVLKIIEKNNRYSLNRILFAPEVYFYRVVAAALPGWPRAPRCHQWAAGWFGYQLFLEYVPGGHVNLHHDFERVHQAINALQNEAPSYSALSETDDRLIYFKTPPAKRFRGDYPLYLARLARDQMALPADSAETLRANLRRLDDLCGRQPATLNHLDLMPRNIVKHGEQMVFIDWEKFAYAPAGFSHGNWLYTAFRKGGPELLPRFASRWRAWLSGQSPTEQNLQDRLTSGLFCYICFVLEYLTRPSSRLTSGHSCELRKTLTNKFIGYINPLLNRDGNLDPLGILERMVQPYSG